MVRDEDGVTVRTRDVHPSRDTDTSTDDAVLRLATFAVATAIRAGADNDPQLSATQVRVLVVLGAAADGATLTEVATALGASAPSASRLCRRLHDHGLVDRSPGEGKTINLRLSARGQDTLQRVNASRLEQLAVLFEALPEDRRGRVRASVRDLGRVVPPAI